MNRSLEALALGLVLGILLGLAIGHAASATPPSVQEITTGGAFLPVPADAWHQIEAPQPSVVGSAGASADVESGGVSSPSPGAALIPQSVAGTGTPATSPEGSQSTSALTGTASWYCLSKRSACTVGYPASGYYAAAGPALRVGAWRGRYVTVNGIRVRLVDWCACGSRLIDLYASVFTKLAPLSRGTITVTVAWN